MPEEPTIVLSEQERWMMQRALALARAVEGRTSPRPPVGAVLVRDGQMVGQGATAPPYGPHAEAEALREAGSHARGADLYVTLEPCCIALHTPPCTEALIAAGVRRVVVAACDPNPRVDGRGLQQLRQAGIEVALLDEDDPLARQARELLRPFATFVRGNRPYVTAKWAMTLDGKIAAHTGDAFWISGPQARAWAHELRDRVDGILVGAGTARRDDPLLTVRLTTDARRPRLQPPRRLVITSSGQLPPELRLLTTPEAGETWLLIGERVPAERRAALSRPGVRLIEVPCEPTGRVDLRQALQRLAAEGLIHILLEGGAALTGSAFDCRCIDHVAAIVAPRLIGGASAPVPLAGQGLPRLSLAATLDDQRTQALGDDLLIEGEVCYHPSSSVAREAAEERRT
ncbi:MAG: bifunctional diaminohydroxyphosphoribosylaminopyrimidine deaminase/5-amino-6-(5-phosphoribosylamino)uracil reductase RibD [Thermogemmatispora sp.]|uniref:bifunctional diaminohydroxyphosphoribosylaminopyrimidine deaminase/5-amino-6-(5-phosphoribosylamino)uracil reductase RibD n=1 Tax=Thermogemmatispora sp. TaxID=1968838 RepID=UPI0026022554|nr:bifunctional diaminohydroxyphosphoribosylaminopyrimidine deaminase/5-amino-6-(5-phosphoribosylamino)uracil reductase RibD [Thermogemmatispora sp.]MBX5455645.1 bifunctional diaminohydroxyphosphoribosylaminopyrimidine deaminase/5-amino-6-(5-phosphoribosylamino)uracil reductase RibD [Thermogemmatispora sp.]